MAGPSSPFLDLSPGAQAGEAYDSELPAPSLSPFTTGPPAASAGHAPEPESGVADERAWEERWWPTTLLESESGGIWGLVRPARERAALLAEIAGGQRIPKELANKIFFLRHPDRRGTRIASDETALATEWQEIHDMQVIPLLLSGPYIGPIHAPGPPGPELRKGVPADAVLSPLAITRRGLRKAPNRQPGTIAAVVVHNTSRGSADHSRDSGYSRPAIEFALHHYLELKQGFPHYVVDFNGTVYATCDEAYVAHHAGWDGIGGRAAFGSGWSAPEWWRRVWAQQGASTPLDLLPKGARTPNQRTIGIELLILPNFRFTPEQYRALARLILDIQRRNADLRIEAAPSRALLGHEDFTPLTRSGGRADRRGGWDPGAHRENPYFAWARLWTEMQSLRGADNAGEVASEAAVDPRSLHARRETGEEPVDDEEVPSGDLLRPVSLLGPWITLWAQPNNHFGGWPPAWFTRAREKTARSLEAPLLVKFQPYWPLQLIEDARSYDAAMDLYRLSIGVMPSRGGRQLDHRELLRLVRLNLNDFIKTRYATFRPYDDEERAIWESADPRGAIISIDALGPDNFGVMCIGSGEQDDSAGWTFHTMMTNRHGHHPLSGLRTWGVRKADRGYEFFTMAIDRWHGISSGEAGIIGLGPVIQRWLWESLIAGVASFVQKNGGEATPLPAMHRTVQWAKFEGLLSRERIDLAS